MEPRGDHFQHSRLHQPSTASSARTRFRVAEPKHENRFMPLPHRFKQPLAGSAGRLRVLGAQHEVSFVVGHNARVEEGRRTGICALPRGDLIYIDINALSC